MVGISIACALLAVQEPLFYFAGGFDGRVSEYSPISPEEACAQARRGLVSRAEADTIMAFFHPNVGIKAGWAPPRLAIFRAGQWLVADKGGFATRAGRRGWFDVVAYERFLRQSPERSKRLGDSPLVTLSVVNLTSKTLRVRPDNVPNWTTVSPRMERIIVTWFVAQHLSLDGVEVGTVRADFSSIRKAGRLGIPLAVSVVKSRIPRGRKGSKLRPFDRSFRVSVGA